MSVLLSGKPGAVQTGSSLPGFKRSFIALHSLDNTISQNEYGRGFRSIVVRMQDHTGASMIEWVSY